MDIITALAELDRLKKEQADKDAEIKALLETLENVEREARAIRSEIDSRRDESRIIIDKIKVAVHAADGLCQEAKRVGDKWYRRDELCDKKAKPGKEYCGIHLRGKK